MKFYFFYSDDAHFGLRCNCNNKLIISFKFNTRIKSGTTFGFEIGFEIGL